MSTCGGGEQVAVAADADGGCGCDDEPLVPCAAVVAVVVEPVEGCSLSSEGRWSGCDWRPRDLR